MPDVIYGVTWNNKNVLNYTYDSLGRLTNKKVNSVLNNNYSYVDVNSTKTTTLLSSLSTVAGTYTYTYDSLGNITSITDGTYTTSYEYDDLNQLVRENDQKAGVTYTYEYSNGNITSKKEYAYTTGELGSVLSTDSWIYGDSEWADLLTQWNNKSITYDEIGNPITYGNYTINWNGRRLESINLNDTEVLSYEYNIDGQRVSKTVTDPETNEVTTTEYFYNGSILAGQKTGDNVLVFMYDNNGDVFGFTYNGTPYYYVKNAQNDVWLITDENGQAVILYFYDAWGKVMGCLDGTDFGLATINPITYRSYYADLETGLYMYYLNSRYYVADWGRFLSADALLSTEQGMIGNNMFAYCGNNPVLRSDTSGNFWETVFDVVSLCVSIVDVASNPRDPGAWVGLVADAVDLIPFVTGVGEVVRSINVTRKALDTVDTLNDARKAAKTASNTYQAAKTGKKVANTGQATKKLHRPYIRKSVIETVENRAAKSADGLFLDANTKTPIVGKYDLGHVYGHEFWRERDLAMSKGWTQKQFNDYMNNPDFYQIENPKYNRAHIFEMR